MKTTVSVGAFFVSLISAGWAGIIGDDLRALGVDGYEKDVEENLKTARQLTLQKIGFDMETNVEEKHGFAGLLDMMLPVEDDGTEAYANREFLEEVYEADMILTRQQSEEVMETQKSSGHRSKRKVMGFGTGRWDAPKKIPYTLHPSLDTAAVVRIREALKHWEEKTCIRFKERKDESDFITFFKGAGCYSNVGRTGGEQYTSIGVGCYEMGTIAHEVGHALGFHHEQSRSDRDSYVHVMTPNIKPRFLLNFNKFSGDESNTYKIPYNYESLMHYGSVWFTNNGEITLKTLHSDPEVQKKIGQRAALHACDIEQMNNLYCMPNCKVSSWGRWSRCKNGCALKFRTRRTLVAPVGNGALCPPLRNTAGCPGHCKTRTQHCAVSRWSKWNPCSKTCGGGVTWRSRKIVRNRRGKGRICPPLKEFTKCGVQPCCAKSLIHF